MHDYFNFWIVYTSDNVELHAFVPATETTQELNCATCQPSALSHTVARQAFSQCAACTHIIHIASHSDSLYEGLNRYYIQICYIDLEIGSLVLYK